MSIYLYALDLGFSECFLALVFIAIFLFIIVQVSNLIKEFRENKKRKVVAREPLSNEKLAELREHRIQRENLRVERRAIEVKEAREKEEELARQRVFLKEEQTRKEIERKQEEERKEAERHSYFAQLKSQFVESQDYKLVRSFVKKYDNNETDDDLFSLQLLLDRRGWVFSFDELKDLIYGEYWRKLCDLLLKRVFAKSPATREEAIRGFLEQFRSDDREKINCFTYLLKEHGFSEFNAGEIKKVEQEIELEKFEKRLSESDERVNLHTIDQLTGYEFEGLLKKLFSKMGYDVEQTRLSGDQGADLIIVKFGERKVVQAKRAIGKVGNKAVQEIVAAISMYRSHRGMIVTNNYFTAAAVELANANGIELIDRDGLEELIDQYW